MKEKTLQSQCFQWAQNEFGIRGELLIHAIPNEVVFHPGLLPGAADLFIAVKGRGHYVELKTATGRQSRAQRLFEEKAKAQGMSYVVIRSLSEFKSYVINLLSGKNEQHNL
ncbi:MAG: hypothetical protein GC193_13220 [Cryomorphaceae bacterium]|nr:hypothetical protein [Cryomorphaceae bacterium]